MSWARIRASSSVTTRRWHRRRGAGSRAISRSRTDDSPHCSLEKCPG